MKLVQSTKSKIATGVRVALYPLVSAGLLAALAPASFGQGTDQVNGAKADTGMIEEIIVSARRREEKIQDVPVSITAFSGADLQAMSVTNLKEMGHFTTNMTVNDHAQNGNTATLIYVRGIGQDDPGIQWEPGVGMYVDGIYNGRLMGVDIDLMEVERLEVLRGPQGTLFGRNTIGGAINVVSVKPDTNAAFSGQAEITTGSYDRLDGRVSLNVPLVPGKLAAKVGMVSRARDGYGRRLDFDSGETLGKTGDIDRQSAQLMLNWTPSEDLGVLFSLDGTQVNENGPVRKLLATAQPPIISLNNILAQPPYSDVFLTNSPYTNYADGRTGANEADVWGAGLTIDWDISENMYFKSITSYRDTETLSSSDEDLSTNTIIHTDFALEQDQFSQEFQLGGVAADGRLDWLTGFFYFEEDASTVPAVDALFIPGIILGNDFSLIGIEEASVDSYALFGQGTYSFSDQLSMTAGLRYTDDDKDVGRGRGQRYSGVVTVPFDSRNEGWDDVSGRVGIEYRFNDDVMAYASFARGYKSGGINARSVTSTEFRPFDPETVLTYEVGVRSDWMDNRLRFNATLFFNDYEDIQFLIQANDPETLENLTFVDNAAAAEIKGFELELIASPASGFNISAAIGHTDAEYTDVDPGSAVSADTNFINTPEWSGVLSARYSTSTGLGVLTGRVDYTYQSETYYDIRNSPLIIQDSYGLLRVRVDIESKDGDWMFSVFGTNLTDEEYFTAGNDVRGAIGFAQVQFARPREWGASLRFNF